MDYPGFCGSSYPSQAAQADVERVVNWYYARIEAEVAAARDALLPTPGVTSFAESTETSMRAIFAQDARLFVVIGRLFQEITLSDGTVTTRGTVLLDRNPAQIASNGDGGGQLLITSGGRGDLFDVLTNTYTPGVVLDAQMCGMLDSYFIRLDVNNSEIGVSGSYDGLTWDGAAVAQRADASDRWQSMLVANSKIYLFGDRTSGVWYNYGGFPLPFKVYTGATIPYGIAGAYTAVDLNGSVIWLAQTKDGARDVVRAQGYAGAESIANEALAYQLSRYSRVDDAEAWAYEDQLHRFYVLSFPSANATWVFDDRTNQWHERGTWNSAENRYDVLHARFHAYTGNKHLVGDRNTGTVYRMGIDLGLDAGGVPLRRLRIAPPLPRDYSKAGAPRKRIVNAFRVKFETGLALASGQGSDPQARFSKSANGGKTWGSFRDRSIGARGKYSVDCVWNRVGAALDFVPQVVVTDPIPWRATGADLQVRA